MRFLDLEQCAAFCERVGVVLDESRLPTQHIAARYRLRCAFPRSFTQLLWFSKVIESVLHPRDDCLLWVTEAGVFPSNENWHAYYRVRQSYRDDRLLHEAPGHYCLGYEVPEVITFVQFGILFGWDLHLVATNAYARAFISHDEWIEIGFDDHQSLLDTRQLFEEAQLSVTDFDAS